MHFLSLLPLALAMDSVEELHAKWATDWSFSGVSTFAHLPSQRCLLDPARTFDVAVIGVPFDTAVSYRPGARFGPRAIRAASSRQTDMRGFNARAGFNPFQDWADVFDCDDIPVTPMDNRLALHQMTDAFGSLLEHNTTHPEFGTVPRLVALGGDHSVILPHLRALAKIHGPISVIHFDAHLDTWLPNKYPSSWDESLTSGADMAGYTHGTMFWMAWMEGLLSKTCIHGGLRTRLSGTEFDDYNDDSMQGWARISTDDIDDIGVEGIVDVIKRWIPAGSPVYISVDIDVLDPSIAPGTGTPEVGGWTSRELIRLLRSLGDLNLVGADVVEVSPAYDNHAENTALNGAQVAYELLTSMVMDRSQSGPRENPSRGELGLEASYYDKIAAAHHDVVHEEL